VSGEGALSVSVALCTFNGERYIEEQLVSILTQTRPPVEVVISDDMSTDATLDIARRVASAHGSAPVRILHNVDRLGVTRNFERAVAASIGDVIALSDQDDRWYPERVEALMAVLEANPAIRLVHHDAALIGADGKPLGHSLLDSLRVSRSERTLLDGGPGFTALIRRNLATGATMMFRRELLDVALPFPASWVHDEWLAVVAAATGGVRLIERDLVAYRQHEANQIGVQQPTLRYRARRMLEKRGDRYGELATKSRTLADRLASIGVEPRWLDLARRKAEFEAVRARYPESRLRRIPAVLRQSKRYPELSSQRALDLVRDLVQPA